MIADGAPGVWWKLFWLAVAGASGTLSRFAITYAIHRRYGGSFPWGTLTVNCVGCFIFGLVWTLAEERLAVSGELRVVLLTGFLGAFTTFSAFAFETGELLRNAAWTLVAANLLANNVLGLALFFAGVLVARKV